MISGRSICFCRFFYVRVELQKAGACPLAYVKDWSHLLILRRFDERAKTMQV